MIDGCNGNVRELERRDWLLKWGRRAGCVALVVALGYGSLHGYRAWRQQHLEKQTTEFARTGDLQSGVLVARRLLELDPENLAACRAMAEMAEKSGKPEAVAWRQKIAHKEGTPANQLALARTALKFAQRDLAEAVLNAMPESARASADYHQIAGAEALARKDVTNAEAHFSAAVQLAPDNPQLSFNLCALRLTSSDTNTAHEARERLVTLSDEPIVRVEALRALAADALLHGDRTQAANWATRLRSEPASTFGDALIYFQSVEGTDAAATAMTELQTKAAASPVTAAELITWMNRQGMGTVAALWSSSLPQEIRETQPVPLAIAESYSFMRDWPALRSFVEGKNWGQHESLRLAVEAHALHRLSPSDRESMQTQTTWRAALKAAHTRPEQLIAIAQLAEGWGYLPEAIEAWWEVADGKETARLGLTALQRLYKAKQDTRGLLRVAKRALELNPNDLVAANNAASLGLLLNSDSTARRLASKLHEEHPANRAFAATYAFALHTEGKRAEALRLLETLKEQELRHPSIAAYYVMMLVENGNLERARSFLVDARRAALLPEEQQLLDAAARKLIPDNEAARGVAKK